MGSPEPEILTRNTYHWSPKALAHQRRWSEYRHITGVQDWLEELGLEVVRENPNTVRAAGQGFVVVFFYKESTSHVYKRFSVYQNGIKKNIVALRKLGRE